jgi:hypothetical protein
MHLAPWASPESPIASAGHGPHEHDQRDHEQRREQHRGGDELRRLERLALVVRPAADADEPRQHGLHGRLHDLPPRPATSKKV